jgi:spore coat protein CotH
MSTHKNFDKICCVVLALTIIITVLFINGESLGIKKASSVMGYEEKLFDTSYVHTVNIIMDDWDDFISNCTSEEYYTCTVVIDNEAYKNVAIRGKGNTSLTQVASYGNNRYSFKIEFDHYDSSKTYYGLDKLCLNNIIQDNTYMKDFLVYQMMNFAGVASPLCSYVYITVNGEDWGLYLAVEGIEESFLQRNYGKSYGELYKPDSMSMGGGRGNGKDFEQEDFSSEANESAAPSQQSSNSTQANSPPEMPDGDFTADGNPPDNKADGNGQNGGGNMNASDDVLLKYIDDDYDSYQNIFDNAKTDITDDDKDRLISSLKTLSSGENTESAVNVSEVISYFAVHNFVLNFDSYTGSMIHNYYLYENDGQMQMIPWDYNLAFGGFQSSGDAASLVNYPIDTPVSSGSIEDRPMLAWIFASEEYTEQYHKALGKFIDEYFDSGYFENMIDSVISMISPYVEKDPTKFCTYEQFQTGVQTLKEFCILRAESISGQLSGTIGSTSDTQSADTLIDAGDLKISDMGSMNNSNSEPGGGQSAQDGNMPNSANGSESSPPEKPSSSDTQSSADSRPTPPDGTNENGLPPQGVKQNGQPNGQQDNRQSDSGADGNLDKPEMPDNEAQSNTDEGAKSSFTSSESYIYLAICIAVLILGIMFAVLFKKRK